MNWKINKIVVISLIISLFSTSCDDFFELDTQDLMLEEEAYNDRATIYAGMTGLAVTFRSVVEEHVIASELMGDLMEPTRTAPDEYWNMYRYKFDALGNATESIASPARYYKLIVNSNDYLKHLIDYNKNFPEAIPSNVYRGLVSSTLTYRTWAYLQIAKFYGEAYYYDLTYISGDDVEPGKLLSMNELIQELIYNMKIGVDGVNAYNILDWRTIINPETGASAFDKTWSRISIDPDMLLTELYLWAGDFIGAAQTGINYVARPGDAFKLREDRGMNYLFRDPNVNEMTNAVITMVPYNFNYRQTHTLRDYFSNTPSSLYYFKPTQTAMGRFGSQIQDVEIDEETGEYVFERGSDPRSNVSFRRRWGSEAEIIKYDWTTTDYQDDSPIYVYRSSEMFLMIAEALNGLGNNNAADSILNVGLRTSWDGANNFFNVPFESPIYSSTLSGTRGIRGRANVHPNYVRYYLDSTRLETDDDFIARKKFVLDSLLAEETALELAYEGKRWFSLMRIARNSGKPELLAEPVSKKFGDEQEIYKRWLMKPENWFIEWDQTKVGDNVK